MFSFSSVAVMAPSKKAAKGKLGPTVEKKKIPVETDPYKLVNFVCGSSITKEGKDIELKPDSEYPEWLWQLRLDGPPALEDLDPETLEYWRRVRKLAMRRNMVMLKLKKF
nr:EOG090X0KWJ [Eulimnadia texana]